MQKILGEAFATKCRNMLKVPGANMHSVARKLGCSPSTVYRATGGKKRANEQPVATNRKWMETTRKSRTITGRSRTVGRSKAQREKERRRGRPDGRTQRHTRKRVLAGTI